VYLLKASETDEFYRYIVTADTWEVLADAPGGPSERFKKGTSISYDGADTIYVLKGLYNDFYAYVVSADTWLSLTPLPDQGGQGRRKSAKGGAAIVYHNRNVHCLKGSNSQEFWIYKCDSSVWRQSEDIPLGDGNVRVDDGGAMVYARHYRYLYATKGHSLEFWSYGQLTNYCVDLLLAERRSAGEMGDEASQAFTYDLSARPSLVSDRLQVCYCLPRPGRVVLSLYDALGRRVLGLEDVERLPGRYSAAVDVGAMPRGVYLLKYEAGSFLATQKLIVQR